MTIRAPSPAVQQVLATATQALQAGNLMAAELALAPLFKGVLPPDADVLNITGTLRMNQGRLAEAAALFERAAAQAPREPTFGFNLGLSLSRLGRLEEAEAAFRTTLKHKTDFVPALFEMGALLHKTGRLDEAERRIRQVLARMPGQAHAELALAAILVDAGRPDEAEGAARRGLATAAERHLKAQLYLQLAQALRRQRKDTEALAALDNAETLQPALPGLARHRAETLQNLNRFDESVEILQKELIRTPDDPKLHLDYNALLYQLNRGEDFLKSYARAPESRELLLGKAFLLAREKALRRGTRDIRQSAGARSQRPAGRYCAAQTMTAMGRHDESLALFRSRARTPRRGAKAAESCRRTRFADGGSPESCLALRTGGWPWNRRVRPAWRC
jgi:tetratricopeptide (TPR) repeat protein